MFSTWDRVAGLRSSTAPAPRNNVNREPKTVHKGTSRAVTQACFFQLKRTSAASDSGTPVRAASDIATPIGGTPARRSPYRDPHRWNLPPVSRSPPNPLIAAARIATPTIRTSRAGPRIATPPVEPSAPQPVSRPSHNPQHVLSTSNVSSHALLTTSLQKGPKNFAAVQIPAMGSP